MSRILANWKTTLAGAATIAFTVVKVVWPEYEEAAGLVIGALAGLGLIAAKDLDRSHTQEPSVKIISVVSRDGNGVAG